ncbi:hypothetical protein B14911_09782 [Bacillus sp. NRRL B-14911]|nr:hypothetical protein B14911_09782 [Bacillus sp. NRRL B-14911]
MAKMAQNTPINPVAYYKQNMYTAAAQLVMEK